MENIALVCGTIRISYRKSMYHWLNRKEGDIMKTLSQREEQIMNLLWDEGPMFVKDMIEKMDEPRPHFNTISTFVRSLEGQGYVGHKVYGNTHQYYAVLTREEYSNKSLKSLISRCFNNSYLSVVSSLVKSEEVSIDELKDLIREVEEANKK